MNEKQKRLQVRTGWSNWEIVHATNSMNNAQIEERIRECELDKQWLAADRLKHAS